MLAAPKSQARRNGGHRLALAIELQSQHLPRRQDRRCPLGCLLKERTGRMNVGKGASSKALACQALHARQSDESRVEQPIAVRTVTQRVVDPPVIGGKRPPAAPQRSAVRKSTPKNWHVGSPGHLQAPIDRVVRL